jgi:hypothetical protein
MGIKLLFTLICDDVREERSGKLTIVGLYNYRIAFAAPANNAASLDPSAKFVLPQMCIMRRWTRDASGSQSVTQIVNERGGIVAGLPPVTLAPVPDEGYCQEIIRLLGLPLERGLHTIRTTCSGVTYEESFLVTTQPS